MNFKIFLLGILPFLFLSCHDNDFEEDETDDNTVLVYMVGDNSLNGNISSDMSEMRKGYATIKSPDKNNLLVYVDDYDTPVLIRIKMENGKAVNDTIKNDFEEMDSCDANTITNVTNYVKLNFKAYHYGLVLWSHGSGSKPASISTKSFGWDNANNTDVKNTDNATTMDIPDLKTSLLSTGISFDYILFDACEMQTIEVAYELRNCTDYIIASPYDISTDGGPYDKIIPHCFSNYLSISEKSSKIAEDFYDYYKAKGNSNVGIMMSVVNTKGLEDLADKTNTIIKKYLDKGESINSDSVFNYDDYYKLNYLYDFKSLIISLIKNKDDDYEKNKDYIAWSSAYDNAVPVYKKTNEYMIFITINNHYELDSSESNGISTYIFNNQNFPNTTYDNAWYIYEWYKAAGY